MLAPVPVLAVAVRSSTRWQLDGAAAPASQPRVQVLVLLVLVLVPQGVMRVEGGATAWPTCWPTLPALGAALEAAAKMLRLPGQHNHQ